MYQAHFGLDTRLFDSGIAQETAVFMGPRQQTIAANFSVALSTLDSVIVLTGPAGAGKTTLTAAALRMTHTRLALGWLPSTVTNGAELLEALLTEFGVSAHRVGRVERLQMWRQFLNEMNATDTRVFVIAERADAMDADLLRALESLTAADPNGCPGANLVLLGTAELNERLKAPALASLAQRVRLRQTLEPFTVAELEAYLKRRISNAGGTFDAVFDRAAIASVHAYTNGVARAVNNLCESTLTVAASAGERPIRAETVSRVAVELFGAVRSTEPPPETERAAPPAPMSGAAAQAEPARASAEEFPVLTDAIDTPREPEMPIAASLAPAAWAAAAPSLAPPTSPMPAASLALGAPADGSFAPTAPGSLAPAAPSAASLAPAVTAPTASLAPAVSLAPVAPSSPADAADPPAARAALAAVAMLKPAFAGSPSATDAAADAAVDHDDLAHQTQTLRALSTASLIEDVSPSVAETLFGDADLDMFSAALASAGWPDDEESEALLDDFARTSVEDSVTVETPRGAYASFGRKIEPALSLLEVVADEAPPRAAAKR